jgi:hypothetical protein
MGRSYWFECSKCGYRAKVSGRADRGLHLFVQTISCRDCRNLYDAVIRLRVAPDSIENRNKPGPPRLQSLTERVRTGPAPAFEAALNRLLYTGGRRSRWLQFALQCPVSPLHRVDPWNEPGKCPRCGLLIEKSALPFRIWD